MVKAYIYKNQNGMWIVRVIYDYTHVSVWEFIHWDTAFELGFHEVRNARKAGV